MIGKFKYMSFKEFSKYCNDRAADGQWSLEEALLCLNSISKIYKIKVRNIGSLYNKERKLCETLE